MTLSAAFTSGKRIWLDGRNVGRSGGTGVHHYALNLHHIIQQSGFSAEWLLEQADHTQPYSAVGRFLRALTSHSPTISSEFLSSWGPAHLALDLYRTAHVHYRYRDRLLKLKTPYPPHIMHWTYPLPILLEGCQNIVTIHDLIPLTHPQLTGINPQRFQRLINDLVQQNVRFVTVSETVRQQMLSLFPITEERVTTLYQPVEFDQPTRDAIKQAPQIAPANSFIFYGRIEHRKNIERLLQAHALSQTQTPLILIGPEGDDHPDCTPRGPTSHIIRLPWSNRLSLLRTLSEAKALLFPSLAEGFGLPIIEAMSLGVPVLTSKGGVTEEIAGNAALLEDPTNTLALASAITHLNTLDPKKRNDFIQKGKKHAGKFSYQTYQEKIHTFYNTP